MNYYPCLDLLMEFKFVSYSLINVTTHILSYRDGYWFGSVQKSNPSQPTGGEYQPITSKF